MRREKCARRFRGRAIRAREEQIGDIGARDEQDEADRAEKNEEIDAEVHADHALVWKEVDADVLADVVGKCAVEILKDERVVGGEFGGSDTGLEAREDVDVRAAAHGLGDERERRPNVGRSRNRVRPIGRWWRSCGA